MQWARFTDFFVDNITPKLFNLRTWNFVSRSCIEWSSFLQHLVGFLWKIWILFKLWWVAFFFFHPVLKYITRTIFSGYHDGLLIGDGGYRLVPYLMTPFPHPNTRGEQRPSKPLFPRWHSSWSLDRPGPAYLKQSRTIRLNTWAMTIAINLYQHRNIQAMLPRLFIGLG